MEKRGATKAATLLGSAAAASLQVSIGPLTNQATVNS